MTFGKVFFISKTFCAIEIYARCLGKTFSTLAFCFAKSLVRFIALRPRFAKMLNNAKS